MDAWEGLLAAPSGDFPRGPAPGRALPVRPWMAAMLLAMCLIPRLVAAWNWDVLWGDSLHYRYASTCLEQGDLEEGFAEFGLNVYPLILIPLGHLGIDWQIAGKYFSVLVASLTVLPLWGWLRRMFDDRLAATACLVYAFHGKLIAISPLIIRDPTFLFLLALSLYYVWRAVGELRIGFFLAAGIMLTLAIHTRTEGWLLLVPLLGWGACRWPRRSRRTHPPGGRHDALHRRDPGCRDRREPYLAAGQSALGIPPRDASPNGRRLVEFSDRDASARSASRQRDPAAQSGHGSDPAIGCRSISY